MAVLKKYDLTGKEVGQVAIEDRFFEGMANLQMIKDYLVALRQNARQWSANTKGRTEVNHTGKKPHPQKGTGRARQGCLAAPQYKGGGRVFGPKPKFDQHVRINKKERRAAIRHLLIEKIQANQIHVLKYEPLESPKTKKVVRFLQERNLVGKRVLFLGEYSEALSSSSKEKYESFLRSMRNVPRLDFMLLPNMSGYDVALTHEIVVMEPAVEALIGLLGSKG